MSDIAEEVASLKRIADFHGPEEIPELSKPLYLLTEYGYEVGEKYKSRQSPEFLLTFHLDGLKYDAEIYKLHLWQVELASDCGNGCCFYYKLLDRLILNLQENT